MAKKINIVNEAKKYRTQLEKLLKRAACGKPIPEPYDTRWLGDIADHIIVCNKIIGQKKTPSPDYVHNLMCDLDTSSREELPEKFWDYAHSEEEDD